MAALLWSLYGRHQAIACAFCLLLAVGLASKAALAKTILVTPNGGVGYDAGNTAHPQTRSFRKDPFTDVQAGDTLKFLAESPDPTNVTRYTGRISVRNLQGAANPLVIEGLGARTRIIGLDVDDLRNCPMPDEDVAGCKERLLSPLDAVVLSAAAGPDRRGSDLLASVLRPTPSFPPDLFGLPEGATLFAIKPNPALKKSGFEMAACIDLERVDGVVVRDLHFENCWLVAVRARESSNIALQDAFIVGGSYGLAVSGEPTGRPASNIAVERVTWIQDASAFEGGNPFKGECPPERRWMVGCPGDMWRRLPWGTVHHGAYEHLNGALLGGIHLSGNVVFRHNRVVNAYNGIRLTARSCSKVTPDGKPRTACGFNKRVWIYDNDFSYVRDNPVELEDWAEDAFVFHNRFHNAHAALSFDGMGGGPAYVFGNVGWFDDRPAAKWSDAIRGGPCVHHGTVAKDDQPFKFDRVLDRKFDYDAQVWLPIGYSAADELGDAAEMRCEQSQNGRAIKFSLPDRPNPKKPSGKVYNYPLLAPIYVFHNSWYLRAPVTGGGAPANLRHWNNAFLFCEDGSPGFHDDLCNPEPLPKPGTDECGVYAKPDAVLAHHWGQTGRIPFFVCFRWDPFDEAGQPVAGISSAFDWDVSSNGFPEALRGDHTIMFEPNGLRADPGFAAPERGDFHLRPGAAAGRTGCTVTAGPHGLTCFAGSSVQFAGAFAPDGAIYPGPPGLAAPP